MDKAKIITELGKFISIKSVSANPKMKSEMDWAVNFLTKKLESLKFKVEIFQKRGSQKILLAVLEIPNASKTIGIYGHYDVQPEDPVGEWNSAPFTLTRENGKLFGRGVADNKGHIIQNISAIENLLARGQLKSSIIFLIEGAEEVGSLGLEGCVVENKKILDTIDVFFLTDVEMYGKNIPQIIYSLRGMVYFDVEVIIGEHDLHSGIYGNAVHNPAQILVDLLAKMKDMQTGEVLIPGFYDDVRKIGDAELQVLKKHSMTDDEFVSKAGAYEATSMRGVPAYFAPKLFPSLDVHGFESGYLGEGPKTIIPSKARVKFSCRLVENQDVKKMGNIIRTFINDYFKEIKKISSPQIEIKTYPYDNPFYCSIDDLFLQKTAKILSEHFGHKTVFMREGGSLPVASIIQRILKKPVVMTGFVLPDSNIHAPNENFDEEMFWKGIGALEKLYSDI